MRIVIDTNILIQIMMNDGAAELRDPETNEALDRLSDRAQALVETIDAADGLVVIPAPVLSEYLIGIERSYFQSHLDIINNSKCFEVVSFDQMAAIECALLVDENEQKVLDPDATKAKLRVDRQILSIAIACGAGEIWTHDKGLFKKAQATGLSTKSLASIMPQPQQLELS